MAFSEGLKKEIEYYCSNHLPMDSWYENEFSFINDIALKNRIIAEFKAIRFAYKLYEGIEATESNLLFQVRNQIIGYASIYEAVIEYVLNTFYSDTTEYDSLIHHNIPIKISIPKNKQSALQKILSHNGKTIFPFYYDRKKKEKPQIRFDDKCKTAKNLGLIHSFISVDGTQVDFPEEIITIYSFRNGIHIIAEQRKGIEYEIELSKLAYQRMRPFADQLKKKLLEDGKI